MIDRDDKLPVSRQAKLLQISRGTVYYTPRPTSEADLELLRRIDELHLEHPFMGQRMLVRQLKRQGVQVGRLHVRTLMLRMGICAMAPQPGTNQPAPGHNIYPYLPRHVPIIQANQVWALDATYIPMAHDFVYLTAVVDVASRRVMAHKVAISLEACHATEVIKQALARYGTPTIVNTDQGSQFTAQEFTAVVLGAGCQLRMDGRDALSSTSTSTSACTPAWVRPGNRLPNSCSGITSIGCIRACRSKRPTRRTERHCHHCKRRRE